MKDKILIGTKGTIRLYVARITDLLQEARIRHGLYPIASAALGRTMAATAIMGAMLKNDETVVSVLNGGGPLGTVMAEASANGDVRGYVAEPTVHVTSNKTGKLAVGYAVGNQGYLKVIKDLKLREAFTGQVDMISGEIAEEFTRYFAVSEQVPSVVSLGVLVNPDNSIEEAGGFVIQLMPGYSEDDIVEVENAIKDLEHMSTLLKTCTTLEELARRIIPKINVLEYKPVQ